MGQKINPHVLRLGPLYDWNSRWFDERTYKRTMLEDHALRKKLLEKLKVAGVASIDIERSINSIKIIAHVSRPGRVIGRAGTGLEDLKKFLVSLLPKKKNMPKIDIQVEQVKEPNLDAFLVAKNVADQLEKRLPFKRILIQNVDRVMTAGARGVKIALAGRIAGAEIGRK
ncbi:MAG: 30S ribosomal protein S3, partial [Patescibacteria group bacterium]